MSKIELGKTYRTRGGREVRIYAVDGEGLYSVHGAVSNAGKWELRQWKSNGHCHSDDRMSPEDLIEVEPRIRKTVWFNVYRQSDDFWISCDHPSRSVADKAASNTSNRISCVKVEIYVEHGHGLNGEAE